MALEYFPTIRKLFTYNKKLARFNISRLLSTNLVTFPYPHVSAQSYIQQPIRGYIGIRYISYNVLVLTYRMLHLSMCPQIPHQISTTYWMQSSLQHCFLQTVKYNNSHNNNNKDQCSEQKATYDISTSYKRYFISQL